jgi:hypothetical protein
MSAVVASAVLSACSDTTLGSFSADEPIPVQTIPSIGLAIPLTLPPINIPLDIENTSAYQNANFDFVTFVRLKSVTLELDPSTDSDPLEDGNLDDMDFISELQVYLSAEIDGVDKTELIASLPPGDPQIGSGVRKLELTTTGVDVLDYIEAPNGYNMAVSVSGITPLDEVVIGGSVSYRVGIGFR